MDKRSIRRAARALVADGARELADECWREDWDEPDRLDCRGVFLGTVFMIMPSGKYYMPWACSNVEPCSRCRGDGCDYCGGVGSREAYEDELMAEALEHYSDRRGLSVQGGDGDPCDIFLVEYRDTFRDREGDALTFRD